MSDKDTHSLRQSVYRFNEKSRALGGINIGAQFERLKAKLDRIQELPRVFPRLMQVAAKKTEPFVRKLLEKNYKRAGIGIVSGELINASARHARVTFSSNGRMLVIEMAQNAAGRVYSSAGAFRFGAVRNTQFKATYVDLPTGSTKTYKAGKGGIIGARAKRTIKKYAFKGGEFTQKESKAAAAMKGGSVIVIRPKSPFFNLDADIPAIQKEFLKHLQEGIDSFLAFRSNRQAA